MALMHGMGAVCAQTDDSGNCISYLPEYVAPTTPAAKPFDWSAWTANLIGGAAKTTEGILTAQNQTKGVYTQTNKDGTITYVQPAGNTGNIFTASSTGITGTGTANSGMGMILIAGAAMLVLFMMMGRK